MSIFGGLRIIVYLRRIAIALERGEDALNELRVIERERWARETKSGRPKPQPTEFGTFDIDEANDRWRKELEAREYGGTLEDRS
jgi:hypothetical protein